MLDNEPQNETTTGAPTEQTAPAARRTRRRTASTSENAETVSAAEATDATEAAPKKATRSRAKKATAEAGATTRTRRTRKAAADDGQAAFDLEGTDSEATASKAAAASESGRSEPARPAMAEPAAASPAAEPAGDRDEGGGRTRRRRGTAATFSVGEGESEGAPEPSRRRGAPTVALFVAPVVDDLPSPAAAAPARDAGEAEEAPRSGRPRRRNRRAVDEPVEAATDTAAEATDEAGEDEDDEEFGTDAAGRRRRRRGRRGRGRGKGPHDEADEDIHAEAESADGGDDDDAGDGGDGPTRRRRKRRRRGSGAEELESEDGVVTVVKIREPRPARDEVQGVTGSTRLEAKRQRRRDGREQRRTRPAILSESEFLARREAVDRVMAIRQRGDRTQIAVLEDGVLVEHYVTRASSGGMVGNVYLGKVQNVLPSMEAAFVDIGRGRNAVLYAGEVNWDMAGLEGRARSIEQALKPGDSVLVQVTKDPIGHKGARLTSHVALSGRHLVYVPNGNTSGISRKLSDVERKRLRDILKRLIPESAGVIVRTAAEGASEDELERDVTRLQAQWADIEAKVASGNAPVQLYEEPDLVIRVVRDMFNEDFRELVIQGDDAYETVESYLSHVSPDLVQRLRRHAGAADIFSAYRVDEQILKGLDRKVFLPSGGSLVIDRTEAMTVIDVNTGKYTGTGGNLEETVTRNNLEAAEEIVRQLRLRDLGGIIVIDFIDMVLESNRELVLRRLTECLGRDRTKHQVTEITSLGLVQMTRKRIGQGLLEAFSDTCEHCKGRGVIIHLDPVPERRPVVEAPAAEAEPATRRRGRRGRGGSASAEVEPVDVEVDSIEPEVEIEIEEDGPTSPDGGAASPGGRSASPDGGSASPDGGAGGAGERRAGRAARGGERDDGAAGGETSGGKAAGNGAGGEAAGSARAAAVAPPAPSGWVNLGAAPPLGSTAVVGVVDVPAPGIGDAPSDTAAPVEEATTLRETAGFELGSVAPMVGGRAGFEFGEGDRAGFDQAGFDQAGFDQAGFKQAGVDQAGFERAGEMGAGGGAGTAIEPASDFTTFAMPEVEALESESEEGGRRRRGSRWRLRP